jgi:hypothetical protein
LINTENSNFKANQTDKVLFARLQNEIINSMMYLNYFIAWIQNIYLEKVCQLKSKRFEKHFDPLFCVVPNGSARKRYIRQLHPKCLMSYWMILLNYGILVEWLSLLKKMN